MATVLIVDDDSQHRAKLRQGIAAAELFDRILEAASAGEGLQRFASEAVDLVVCAVEQPDLDAERLLRLKTAGRCGTGVPFVFLTASRDPVRHALLLEAGAADALTKPCHARELGARLRLHLAGKWLRDELIESQENLAAASHVDPLTGLRNRRFLMEALLGEFLRARRFELPLTVVLLEIDELKELADRFGPSTAEGVLQRVGEIVRKRARATDVAGRYNGEQLAVALTHTGLEGGLAHGEQLRGQIEQQSFSSPDGEPIPVTVSVGVASYDAGMKFPEDLLVAAQRALDRAKRNGGNRVDAQL